MSYVSWPVYLSNFISCFQGSFCLIMQDFDISWMSLHWDGTPLILSPSHPFRSQSKYHLFEGVFPYLYLLFLALWLFMEIFLLQHLSQLAPILFIVFRPLEGEPLEDSIVCLIHHCIPSTQQCPMHYQVLHKDFMSKWMDETHDCYILFHFCS